MVALSYLSTRPRPHQRWVTLLAPLTSSIALLELPAPLVHAYCSVAHASLTRPLSVHVGAVATSEIEPLRSYLPAAILSGVLCLAVTNLAGFYLFISHTQLAHIVLCMRHPQSNSL